MSKQLFIIVFLAFACGSCIVAGTNYGGSKCQGKNANDDHRHEMASTRHRRSLMDFATNGIAYIIDTFLGIMFAPFTLFFNLLTEPVRFVGGLLTTGMLNLTRAIEDTVLEIAGRVSEQLWEIIKGQILPKLDESLMSLSTSDGYPGYIKTAILSAHSIYKILQLFGFLKPS